MNRKEKDSVYLQGFIQDYIWGGSSVLTWWVCWPACLSLQLCSIIVCLFLIHGLLKSFYLFLFFSILGGYLPPPPPQLDETLIYIIIAR